MEDCAIVYTSKYEIIISIAESVFADITMVDSMNFTYTHTWWTSISMIKNSYI